MKIPDRDSADTEPYVEFSDDDRRLDALKSRDKRLAKISFHKLATSVVRYAAAVILLAVDLYVSR